MNSNDQERRVEYREFLAKIDEINEKIHEANVKAAKQETEQTIHTLQLGIDIKKVLEEIKEIRREHAMAITAVEIRIEKFEEDKIEPMRKDIRALQDAQKAVIVGSKTFWFVVCSFGYFIIHFFDRIYTIIHKL